MATIPGRTTYAWKKLVRRLKETATHCAKCGKPLYPGLRWPHPYSTTGGHIRSWRDYPELREYPNNVQAEHLRCNSQGGADMTNGKAPTPRRVSNPDW